MSLLRKRVKSRRSDVVCCFFICLLGVLICLECLLVESKNLLLISPCLLIALTC